MITGKIGAIFSPNGRDSYVKLSYGDYDSVIANFPNDDRGEALRAAFDALEETE